MDIPFYGYLNEWEDAGDSNYSKNLYNARWNGNQGHVHQISGITSSVLAHNHHFIGTTEPSPSGINHTHRFFVYTLVADGHIHQIRGVTGPAIHLPNGSHYHEFQGETIVGGTLQHTHSYGGWTSAHM